MKNNEAYAQGYVHAVPTLTQYRSTSPTILAPQTSFSYDCSCLKLHIFV